MRLQLLTRNLPPLTGGMERLNATLIDGIHGDIDVHVIGPPDAAAGLPDSVDVEQCGSAAVGPYLLEAALRVLKSRLTRRTPHLILATSGLTAPLAWLSARLAGCPFVVCVHGLDLVADSRIYQSVFVPFLRRAQAVVVNSRNTARLAATSGIAHERISVINPGIEWPRELPSKGDFRKRHQLGEGPVLLAVGRLTVRKGVAEFIEHSMPHLLAEHADLKLLVIGEDATQAIRREGSVRARIEAAIARADLGHAVILLGQVDDVTLGEAFVNADLHILPVIPTPHDVEGFGMVAAEAAAHGLPTIAFAEGGVPDAVIAGTTGDLAPPGAYDILNQHVLTWLADAEEPSVRARCREAARQFDQLTYVKKMRALLAASAGTTSA